MTFNTHEQKDRQYSANMDTETKDVRPMLVERYESSSDGGEGAEAVTHQPAAMGTGTISDLEEIFLIPAPSADPQDPLNMTKWKKITFVILTSICAFNQT